MTDSKNMHFTEPANFRNPKYGEHRCLIFKDGAYVGMLYLDAKMRKVWRSNKFTVSIRDI